MNEEASSSTPASESPKPQTMPGSEARYISGFWRRTSAFGLDLVILLLVLGYPAYRWFHFFSLRPGWTLLIGFALSFLYFVTLNSQLGNGQTVGKRAFGIRVVNLRGEAISLGKSALRFLILATPFFAEKVQFTCSGQVCPLTWMISWFFVGWEAVIIYLYIFNRRTGQSLHDLAAGTYVIETSLWAARSVQPASIAEASSSTSTPTYVTAQRIWIGHGKILSVIFTAAIVLGVFMWSGFLGRTPYGELVQIQEAVQRSGKARDVSLKMTIGNLTGHKAPRHLGVSFVPTSNSADDEKLATEIAAIVLQASPKASEVDFLDIIVQRVADFGLLHYSSSRTFSHSPDRWKSIILQSGAGTGNSASGMSTEWSEIHRLGGEK